MLLAQLLHRIGLECSQTEEVRGLVTDSRICKAGDLFIGMPGSKVDGGEFALQAIEKGAVAAVVSQAVGIAHDRVYKVPDIVAACGELANYFYGYPSQQLQLVGVTGTNGKTTTTHIIEFLVQSQFRPALLGTLYNRWQGHQETANLTTAFAVDLQKNLRRALDSGANLAVMEVSSHALDQGRVWGCRFHRAVFTNLSQDHLDYHGTMENYFAAKALLFHSDYLQGTAVINQDDPYGQRLIAMTKDKLTYSLQDSTADCYTTDLTFSPTGVVATLHSPWGAMSLRSSLVGKFNVMNTIAAVAVALSLGIDKEEVAERLPAFETVPGRLEKVQVVPEQDITVVVDYAHTPDGLEKVLTAMRPFTRGQLIVVFGCGGDRDRRKRPLMGEIAARLADRVIVTSDNPRTEEPQQILQDIQAGITDDHHVQYQIDRRQAILEAILTAEPGDTVVIAGKGHEDYQIIGTTKYPFDDRLEARRALRQRLGV
ncbi:MAG: UDP-N-acetylmuramoyl-L-alanyl-D-glutamate--2,6-diaminopimelate ligase [Pseudanabaenaceae cyanobacterium]